MSTKRDENFRSLRIGNALVEILIDSGSSRSLIREATARALNLQIRPLDRFSNLSMYTANGSKLRIIGTTVLDFGLKGFQMHQVVHVATELKPQILFGGDFLSENEAIINYKLSILSLKDDLIQIPMFSPNDNSVTLSKTTCIPALSEVTFAVSSPPKFNNKSVLLENSARLNPLRVVVAKALTTCKNNKIICRLLNYTNHVVTLKKGLKLAKVEDWDTIGAIQEFRDPTVAKLQPNLGITNSDVELEKFHKQYGFKICPTLTEDQRHELLGKLYAYKHVFARYVTEIKACNGPALKIDLHTNRKMFKRQFKLNEADKAEMTWQISEMQKADVIERSEDPDYNFPAFLVTKKNGQKRLVIDLRGINSLIRPKSVQLPKVDDLLQDITSRSPVFLTTIDISSPFWQIRVDRKSRKYTSFTGPDGRRCQFK